MITESISKWLNKNQPKRADEIDIMHTAVQEFTVRIIGMLCKRLKIEAAERDWALQSCRRCGILIKRSL